MTLKKGDYVLATKYRDGDAGDHFCVGFYDRSFTSFGETRHFVTDGSGKPFRHNGFRRVARISTRRGNWIMAHLRVIEGMMNRFSVWHWYRAPWRELDEIS
jgi:hypothetical protein